ncbi:Na(+)/H(+) exchange regulatory cofactor NHE-RF1-like isoform X9 [Acanthaster planci]|uniref:Na(+)/H(+) exchange regulatory cofactor NHE-RF1-like isoform X9 n=1 Tax=Acanthaster planci TaxID=133434 RepID=A0A8B7YT83_ACAPL|nr:Na(+)/H(+) exchange regulatory cofactor NHE-RF1-like isoform X9 [Acanthaster planci]
MSSKSGKKRSSKSQPDPPGRPRLCRMVKGSGGYGFNLHSKQGQHGQYIRGIDPGSPAEKANLKKGDRVIEVNGVNIERETHAQVVARIRSGGDRTALLVVDPELDVHNKKYALTVDAKIADESQFIEVENSAPPKGEEEEPKVNGEALPAENGVVTTVEVTAEEAPPERIEEPVEEITVSTEESVPVESVPNDVHVTAEEAETNETARQPEENAVEPEVVVAVAAVDVESTPEPAREPSPERESSPEPERDSSPERESEPERESTPEPEPEPVKEPEKEPTPEPEPEPAAVPEPEPEREPTPEPVREPTPEPEPEPARAPTPEPVVVDEPDHSKSKAPPPPEPEPEPVKPKADKKVKESKPERPKEKGGLDLSDMAKARALAAGKKKKKAASSADWQSKYNAFQNLK